jgi:hypothetical protein
MQELFVNSRASFSLAVVAWIGLGTTAWAGFITDTYSVTSATYIDSHPSYDYNHGAMTSSVKAVVNNRSGDTSMTRILLQLPSTTWDAPSGMAVQSLTLYMYSTTTTGGDDGFTARLCPLTQSFVEGTGTSKSGPDKTSGATWETYDGTHLWATAGGDYSSLKHVDAVDDATGGPILSNQWARFDLTSLATDANLQLYGAMIAVGQQGTDALADPSMIASGDYVTKTFDSDDFATTSLRPYVMVTYATVPEPATIVIFASGLGAAAAMLWIRRCRK